MSADSPRTTFDLVSGSFSDFRQIAKAQLELANAAIEQLQGVEVGVVQVEPPSVNIGSPPSVVRPLPVERLALPVSDIPQPPSAPPSVGVSTPDWEPAPSEPNIPVPNLTFGPTPDSIDFESPTPDYTLIAPEMPISPELPDITVPVLLDINVPEFEARPIPTFQGQRPVRDFDSAVDDFDFTPTAYSSALLDQTRAKLSEMQQGGTGLPIVIEQALFARAADREESSEARVLDEITGEFSRRGFTLPPGVMAARMAEARQNAANRRAGLSRDAAIKQAEEALASLRLAVQQSVALEQVLIGEHLQFQQLLFQVARAGIDISIAILDANIRAYNAEQIGYQTDATVFRELINAEAQRVQIYRTQVEAELAKGQLNNQTVELYSAQIRATNLLVERYVSQVNAVRAVSEINSQRIAEFRALVDAYTARVGAYEAEWRAYGESVRAKGVEASIYETAWRGYTARINGWASAEQAKLTQSQFEVQVEQLKMQGWEKTVDRFRAALDQVVARINALATEHQSNVTQFRAEADIERAVQDANLRESQLELEQARIEENLSQERSRLEISQLQEATRLLVSKLDGIARVHAQLTASSLAGISAAAQVSGSGSVSYNYSGEI